MQRPCRVAGAGTERMSVGAGGVIVGLFEVVVMVLPRSEAVVTERGDMCVADGVVVVQAVGG